MRTIKIVVISIAGIIIASILFLHKDISKTPYYVSSQRCKDCHEIFYEGWKNNTLHPKQFRPVTKPEDILGDFSVHDPILTFKKEDVEYVVGNKWEQVYVKKIDGEYYPLPAKWYINKKKWVPYEQDVKDMKETPMSKKCNGCHTTGFDPLTFKFNEFGIGCEACHGPGSTHLQNRYKERAGQCSICHKPKPAQRQQVSKEGKVESYIPSDIITSLNSSVCGQCHNRGTSRSDNKRGGEVGFSFPVNYTPGEDINNSFKQTSIEEDKKGKFWWGNGLSKNRHQEFADWEKSKHSKSLILMKEKHNEQEKERGKMTDECLKCHSTDYRFAKPDKKPSLDSAKFGVTCVSCHDPHGLDRLLSFKMDGTYRCSGCHIDSMSLKVFKKGKPHYPCPSGKVSCADCHMPYTVKIEGAFTIRSHAFNIIPPMETEKYQIPNSCQNGDCHKDKPLSWAIMEFNKFYPTTANKTDNV